MKKFINSQVSHFSLYFIIFLLLALFFHKDVLFNPYNYGRHWDWSMYAAPNFYRNFLKNFFFSINENSLGHLNGGSIAEYFLKSFVYLTYSLFSFIGLSISIPILNKITIFVILTFISSLGVWYLCKKILSDLKEKSANYIFLIAVFSNLLYTFSLILIFDLHGGALNRQIASACFPFFFACLFDYFTNEEIKYIDKRILILSLFFIFFDISNIFYFSVILTLAILLKNISLRYKIVHLIFFGCAISLFNFYWLHTLFFSNVVNIADMVQQKRLSVQVLIGYSSRYIDNLFFLGTPHNLINRTFGANPLIFISYFFLYFFILFNLLHLKKNTLRGMLLLSVAGYFFSTILTNGPLGTIPLYLFLYSIPYLAFIQGAVRYMPNLLIMVIFLFLISSKELIQSDANKIKIYKLLIIPIVAWIILLITHTNLIYLVNKNVMSFALLNDEIGALYQYNSTINIKLNKEKLVYNVLPIPSFNSPYFIDNIYPKTSQGSDTDSYFSKGFIITNGIPSNTSSFLNSFINSKPVGYFYSLTNIKYLLFKTMEVFNTDQSKVTFTYKWINIVKGPDNQGLYKIAPQFFFPKLFSTYNYKIIDESVQSLPSLIKLDEPIKKNVYFFKNQNSSQALTLLENISLDKNEYKIPIIEFKKINPIKYRVSIHEAKGVFPLIFSENLHEGWKTYLVENQKSIKSIKSALEEIQNYKILDGNEDDQAKREELKSYIDKGWITSLGDGKKKEIKHMKWSGNKEVYDYTEKYNIDFVSKKIYGTIQNDNLPNGPIFETWLKRPIENNKNHFMVNGYANSWIIDPKKICIQHSTACIRNSDGSFDFEIVVEFWPQRMFYIGLAISVTTLISCFSYIIWQWTQKKILNTKKND